MMGMQSPSLDIRDSGFIIQNSWGPGWGYKGFALLPYEDFILHATDVWAAQLGVPVDMDVWQNTNPADTEGRQRAASAIPLADIRPFTVDRGNNGKLSDSGDYWTTEADVERLFTEAIPTKTQTWNKRRVLIYLHGGLNSEEAVAQRVVAFRDVLLENEIYPLHIMWESGAVEIITDLIKNFIVQPDERAGGVADWVHKLRDHLVEAKDRTFEITTARLGASMWDEMKRNARLSSTSEKDNGAMQLVAKHAQAAVKNASKEERAKWEFHVVAHSAGSIYFAYALEHFLKMMDAGIAFGSVHFMAPAITVDLFKEIVFPRVRDRRCPLPSLFVLSDVGELDDNVGPYGKSLLYLVSNAFEGKREVPLVGMQRFVESVQPFPPIHRKYRVRASQSGGRGGCLGHATARSVQCVSQRKPWRIRQRSRHHEFNSPENSESPGRPAEKGVYQSRPAVLGRRQEVEHRSNLEGVIRP
jgi:hypothetical protein